VKKQITVAIITAVISAIIGGIVLAFLFPADVDGDGMPNNIDNCPDVANRDQLDIDDNGVGDACDPITKDSDKDSEVEKRRIATDISEMLHDKITNDVLFIQKELNSKEIQEPFDWKVLHDNKFISCGDEGISNIKCPILKQISDKTNSEYAFIFYYPDRIINNTEIKTNSNCIIEISTLNSLVVMDVINEWNDRQWCNSTESILMTDLYHPRNKPTINVSSLFIEYADSNGDKLGLVNAYNLEKSIGKKMIGDYLPTFNLILLDDKNCVAAAISKTNGDTTIHMDEGIWQLTEEKINDTLNIFEDEHSDTNCDQSLKEYNLDAIENVDLTVTENSKDETSKLDGTYSIFELTEVTNKDLGTKTQIDVFHDWHLLVSIP